MKNIKKQLDDEVSKITKLVKKTNRGNMYLLNQALKTKYGELRYLKIRYFDETRLNWEAVADFVVKDRDSFMNPTEVAETIIEFVCDTKNLTVEDIRIERN